MIIFIVFLLLIKIHVVVREIDCSRDFIFIVRFTFQGSQSSISFTLQWVNCNECNSRLQYQHIDRYIVIRF